MKEKILEKIKILKQSTNKEIWIDINSHYGLFIRKFAAVDNQNMIIQIEIRELISNETLDIFTLDTSQIKKLEDTVEYVVKKLEEKQYTMRSAFRRQLVIHNESEKITDMLEFLIGSDIIYGRIMNGSILFTKENMGKEFIVNSHPYKSFAEKGMLDEYEKYLGYSMKCID